jgi:hypothetical protein
MASPSENPPKVFDRGLLRERQQRATQLGAEKFLLDRVVEDATDRLHAVLREFSHAADLGSPGEGLTAILATLAKHQQHLVLPDDDREALPLAPGSFAAGAAIRQRSARRAGAGAACVETRRLFPRGDGRW